MLADEFRPLATAIEDGIIPATVTPWTPEYHLAAEDLREHVAALAATDGVVALMANAHSGECKMLDAETYERVIEVHAAAAGDTPVFAGVYGESSLRAVERAERAVAAGAEALMLLPLDVYAHEDPREPVEHFRRVADAVDVPLIDFQFPTWGSPGVPIDAHVEICSMPQVIGFKEASFDPVRYDRTVRALAESDAEFTMMTGNDTFLYHAYVHGAVTGLIGYANLVPDLHVEKVRAVNRGDLERAREIRERLLPLTNHLFGEPEGKYRARCKTALQLQGVFEHDTVLPPQAGIDDAERADLREILADLGRL
ncbi:MAG: dihydrodipicolinate synthase family protein [Halobacteriaceae archaeon]